jgi:hypothetical protein
MHKWTSARSICLFALVASVAVGFSEPELTPVPYVEYQLNGQLVRKDGGSVNRVPVGLVASTPGRTYKLYSTSLALTGPSGRFIVAASSLEPVDSIAAAVVLPDTFLMGMPRDAQAPEFRQSIEDTYLDDGGFFCGDKEKSRVAGTVYFFSFDTLVVDTLYGAGKR